MAEKGFIKKMKFYKHFLLLFVIFSLLGFSVIAEEDCTFVSVCNGNCGANKGLICSEYQNVCICFDAGYSYLGWNVNTCKPSIYYYGDPLYDNYIQYSCDLVPNMESTTTTPYQCVCQPGYYMVDNNNMHTFDPLAATGCNVCANAETDGMTCTCAGGVAPPDCKYAITLNLNDGTGNLNNTSHCTGNSCNCPVEEPCLFPSFNGEAPSGYTFDGWNTQPNGSGNNYNLSGVVESGGILYARWKKNITFDANDGHFSDNSTTQDIDCYHNGKLNFPASFPNVCPTGYDIPANNKWYTNPDGTGTSYTHDGSNILCDDVIVSELYPKWEYKVKYDKNCPPSTSSFLNITSTCVKNASCELESVPSNITCADGWILDTGYWYQNPEGTGTQYPSGTIVDAPAFSDDGNTTLYAKWTQCPAGTYYSSGNCESCNAGYFCEGNGQQTPCPAGHTSDAIDPDNLPSSHDIDQCYIITGDTGTKFCAGDNLCFTLPDGVGSTGTPNRIYYNQVNP